VTSSPFLKATITGTFRLHPSVPIDFKTVVAADDILPDGNED